MHRSRRTRPPTTPPSLPRTRGPNPRRSRLGVVIYQGPSLLTGEPIVAILTRRSSNRKTGDLPQVWILRADREPHLAAMEGDDAAICGACPHRMRPDGVRTCYVITWQGPRAVWEAWRRGCYGAATDASLRSILAGRTVRLGAYGDPAAVPRAVLERVTSHAAAHVGYTHAWRSGFALADLAMASCETSADASDAIALGYRVFLTRPHGAPRLPGFQRCPASAESGNRLTCERCQSCSGAAPRPHVQIDLHGAGVRAAIFRRLPILPEGRADA